MGKTINGEVLPPTDKDDSLLDGVKVPHMRLVTTGQIKAELGKVYRRVSVGKIEPKLAFALQSILRTMLHATEQEHAHQLAADDPDADTPSLTGVIIIGPGATKKQIADMRSKVNNQSSTTRKEKSK